MKNNPNRKFLPASRNHVCKATFAALLGLLAAASSQAGVLYSQPFNNSGTVYSMNSVAYPSVYDDFTLAGGGIVSTVQWSGIDPDTDITGFTVNIWSDNGGTPGSLLDTMSIAGTAGATPSGSLDGPYPINDYSVTLTTPFDAAAGTEYYLEVNATASGAGGFYWEYSGTGDDGALSIQPSLQPVHLNKNVAFSLDGTTPAPEPPAGILGFLGGIGLFLYCRLTRNSGSPARTALDLKRDCA